MRLRGSAFAIWLLLAGVCVIFFPLIVFFGFFAYAFVLQGVAAVSPDTYRDVTITVRGERGERSEIVRIACVSVVDGISLDVYLTRREFPEFTVIAIEGEHTLIVPIGRECGGRHFRVISNAFVTDSATVPTWVAPADAMGFSVTISSASSADLAGNERVVRDHVARLRRETNWGAIVHSVDGRLENVSERFSGREFDRIQRTDLAFANDRFPSGAVRNGCVIYGSRGSAVSDFRSCVQVWNPSNPDQRDGQEFCDRYRVLDQCSRSSLQGCAPGEEIYRLSGEEEFQRRLGRWTWSELDSLHGCVGIIEHEDWFSLQTLDPAPAHVVLEPYGLTANGRIRQYLRD